MINRVWCICKGNEDRSPMMAAVLQMYLKQGFIKGHVLCESAGILEIADKGGGASPLMIKAAKRIGIDLSSHKSRWVNSLDINDCDLFVCADNDVAAYLIMKLGVDRKKVCNAQISNAWPSSFQRDLDDTAEGIMAAMFRVVTRYFSE